MWFVDGDARTGYQKLTAIANASPEAPPAGGSAVLT
jgi:hypothetical protein